MPVDATTSRLRWRLFCRPGTPTANPWARELVGPRQSSAAGDEAPAL